MLKTSQTFVSQTSVGKMPSVTVPKMSRAHPIRHRHSSYQPRPPSELFEMTQPPPPFPVDSTESLPRKSTSSSSRASWFSAQSSTTPSTLVPSRCPSPARTLSDKLFEKKVEIIETVTHLTLDPAPEKWERGVGFWRCFVAVCIPILLSAFEGSVVSTALPTISSKLGLGQNSPWVATTFLLASIVCQPLYGQLADIWGRRHLMMLAVVIFGLGSGIAGFAKTGIVLIFGRIVQGLGSGGIDLYAELILCDIIPLQKRGHYVAIKAAVYAMGTTVGPVLGGVFAERDWRWCFIINLPICIASLAIMWFWLQVSTGTSAPATPYLACTPPPKTTLKSHLARIDILGITILTSSVVLLLFALTSAGVSAPWQSPLIISTITSGLVGIVLFAFWQRSSWCLNPIMAPRIFSNRTSIAGFAVTMIHGFLTYGYQFYLPPYFQAVLGASPTDSGVFILPCSLTIVVLAAVGGPLLSRYGQYRLMHLVGFGLMALGFALCIGLDATRIGHGWVAFSFLVGIGSGIIVSTTLPTVLVELTDKENAAATGSWAFLRGLGSLMGVAIPGAAFNAEFSALLGGVHDAGVEKELGNGRAYEHASAAFIKELSLQSPELGRKVTKIFTSGFNEIWGICLGLAVAGMLVTSLERQVKLRKELDSDFGLKGKKSPSQSSVSQV